MAADRTRCPACGGETLTPAFRANPIYLRCRSCRSLVDQEPLTDEEARRIYDGPDYFVKDDEDESPNGYNTDYLADRRFIEEKFASVLGHIERYVEPGRLLDVGCGPGFLVSAARDRGWEAEGLEPNQWAASHGRDELGLTIHDGVLTDQFPAASFDAVTLMDVVEHVPDTDTLLDNVARILRPGGVVALLTPDAAAPMSRLAGARWPEVQMPGEHPMLFSRRGLATALNRHGLAPTGWHYIGKRSEVSTLLADVSAAAPTVTNPIRRAVAATPLGERAVELNPRTKVVMYARRQPDDAVPDATMPARVPRHSTGVGADAAIVEELESLAEAERYSNWLYSTFSELVPGSTVAEVGAGIGTFTQRMLDDGAESVLAIEPEAACFEHLERRFAEEPRVELSAQYLPGSADLARRAGTCDLVVCQNVLEHIDDDHAAVAAMADALAPGGSVVLVVPAGPRLFGPLDDAYGHWRRYDKDRVLSVLGSAGLQVTDLYPMNLPGIAGWFATNLRPGARVSSTSMQLYERVVKMWRPVEEKRRPPIGLTLVGVGVRS